jgi:hypothetical protein
MKSPDQPMTLEDLEVILLAAAKISNHRRFVIAGSLSSIGAVMYPPLDMAMSRDLDMYPQLDPERGFVEISRQLGEGSEFHSQNGFYADAITPKLLALPEGWESRLAPIPLRGGVIAIFMDPNDVAIGKLVRGEENDVRWIAAGLKEGILNADVILQRQATVITISPEESASAKALLDSIGVGSGHGSSEGARVRGIVEK